MGRAGTELWAILSSFWISFPAAAQGRDFDLQGFVDRELASGNRRVVVPPGRYRVTPRHGHHLMLQGLQDVEVVAEGVEVVCTQTTRAVTISRCRNLVLRGLTLDYDPLPFTQGRIVELSEDKRYHEVELFEGYPPAEAARPFKYEIFRPDRRTLRCEDHGVQRLEVRGPRRIRIDTGRGKAADPEQVGDLVVLAAEHAPGGSLPHAVEVARSSNVRLEDVTLYASNCFGFLEYEGEGNTYLRCRIDRRPAGQDPVRRADPRLRSLNADAFHSKHAVRGPAILDCTAKFMGDDAVNICGDYHVVMEARGTEFRVLAKHELNLAPGDPVELFAYDGRRLPEARVVRLEPEGRILEEERDFLRRQRMDEGLKTRGCSTAWRVFLDRAVDLPRGSLIASRRRMGDGFRVERCDFGFNRSRGILIKASDGRVADNRVSETWMAAILVAPEYWWLESGNSCRVEIRGNVITGCRGRPIHVLAQGGEGLLSGKFAPAGAHERLVISGNRIVEGPLPGIEVTSTRGLRVENNVFESPRSSAGQTEPVRTVECEDVVLAGNVVR